MSRFVFAIALFLAVAGFASAQTATVTTLYNFTGGTGSDPFGPLIQASDGNFYGSGLGGGSSSACKNSYGCPTVFKLTPTGTLTAVATFTDGYGIEISIEGSDGNFYGSGATATNTNCPDLECGAIYKLTPQGVLSTLYAFTGGADGSGPNPGLIQGSDGNFYGTTAYGGTGNDDYGQGTVFKVTPAGVLTTLHNFCSDVDQYGACDDGTYPSSGLVQGSDGAFYGTAEGGTNSAVPYGGIVYRVTSGGTFTVLCSFDGGDGCASIVGTSGEDPTGALIEGSDGNLVGSGSGLYFQLTPSGSTLYGTDLGNALPTGSLFEGSDLNYYGATTTYSSVAPVLYQVVAPTACGNCSVNTLYTFPSGNALPALPNGLVQGNDGSFYGTAQPADTSEGTYGYIYKATLSPALGGPVQLSMSSQAVSANDTVTLTWKVLNGFSMTLQQCYAYVQNNPTGAGTWTGLQTGSMVDGSYTGSAQITPTENGIYTYALTCGGTESGFASLNVGGLKAQSVTSVSSNSPVTLGSLVTLTANVFTPQSIGPLTGKVTFSYGSLALGTATLSNGTATLNVTAADISTGTYTVTATYSGNTDYNASGGTTSVVVLGYPTTTTFSVTPTTLSQGQKATLTASVSRTGASGTPTGTVTFYLGTYALGSATLSNGTATLTEATNGSIAPGTYNVYAKYNGDSSDQSSTSSTETITLLAATTTTITATPNPVPANQSVTFTVKVKQTYGNAAPTGTVSVTLGSHAAGSATLSDGSATVNFSTVGIAAGTYSAVATYGGNGSNGASSGKVSVTVE